MPIRYVHNDPASKPYLESERVPRAPRAGPLAQFKVVLPAAEIYPLGSPDYVDRQCFEAALCTIETWERIAGPLRFWHNRKRGITLRPRRETGFGASYERDSIGFDYHPVVDPGFFVAASTDAVSHETGHAILDAIRPQLWDSFFAEVAAFHEGFADCISLLVALADDRVVATLLAQAASPLDVLARANPTAQVAESVALYYRGVHGTQHFSSVPRRLRNKFQWAIPSTLPANPGPTTLAREPHSFGQVFAGCFYDCVNNIYRAAGDPTAAGLQGAALIAGRLLATAVDTAPEDMRFFRSVGRAMILADASLNGGDNHAAIRDAFNAHNVQLGSSAMLAPSAGLDGPAPPARGSASRRLNARTRRDLVTRTAAAAGSTVSASPLRVGDSNVVRARLQQPVSVTLASAEGRPVDVDARISQDVLLDGQHGHCVVLGDLPNRHSAVEETSAFVDALAGQSDLHASGRDHSGTHRVRRQGKRLVLRRVRFSCCR